MRLCAFLPRSAGRQATIALAAVIVPVSVATFITSAISTNITNDITRANALAVKLAAEKLNHVPAFSHLF